MINLPSPALIGVVHLPALPGSPANMLSLEEITERAVNDARVLRDAGFDAVVVENFGDVPFSANALSPASIAGMAVAAEQIRRNVGIRVGINALRNDAQAALGIAAAVSAPFVRVNLHTGVAATDQGMLEGQADQTLRYRRQLGRAIAILADVHVKHAVAISEPDLAQAARTTAYRGLADGLIVTGPATGEATDLDHVNRVREAVPDRRVFVGSGVTVDSVAAFLAAASGVIIGTSVKMDGRTENAVDPARARALARAAGRG